MSSLEPGLPPRNPPVPPSSSGSPPPGGNPPPGEVVTLPVRSALILALALATAGIVAAFYLDGPARVVTAATAAVLAFAAAVRLLSRIIR